VRNIGKLQLKQQYPSLPVYVLQLLVVEKNELCDFICIKIIINNTEIIAIINETEIVVIVNNTEIVIANYNTEEIIIVSKNN
jgi:hypothetical protein